MALFQGSGLIFPFPYLFRLFHKNVRDNYDFSQNFNFVKKLVWFRHNLKTHLRTHDNDGVRRGRKREVLAIDEGNR